MFHVIVLLNPLHASCSPRTDLANLMVFYKDLNERFISENPANTVSEHAGPCSTPGDAALPPTQAGSFHLPRGAIPHGQEADLRYAPLGWSCPFQPLSGATSLPVQPRAPCRGSLQVAHSKLSSKLLLKQSQREQQQRWAHCTWECSASPGCPGSVSLPAVTAPWTRAHYRP